LTFYLDYPRDIHAKSAINMKIELNPMMEDEVYLNKLSTGLKKSFEKFTPEIIFFNAGSDILKGDPLGALSISPKGLIKRDELVFAYAKVFLLFLILETQNSNLLPVVWRISKIKCKDHL
jgi:histone deacetylase 11